MHSQHARVPQNIPRTEECLQTAEALTVDYQNPSPNTTNQSSCDQAAGVSRRKGAHFKCFHEARIKNTSRGTCYSYTCVIKCLFQWAKPVRINMGTGEAGSTQKQVMRKSCETRA